MNVSLKNWAWMVCGAWLLTACGDNQSSRTVESTPPPPVITVQAPEFNADSAYHFIEKQVSFGPRVPNTAAHRRTGDYLINQLKQYGAEVTVQEFVAEAFDGTKLQSRNIIGSFFPEARRRILLAAHWDTRPFADKDTVDQDKPIDGANDGGSGVGVLLEIARIFHSQGTGPGVGVDIILFDSEDYGERENTPAESRAKRNGNESYWALGSQYWARNKHQPGYSAYYGILLDMVGAKDAIFAKEYYSKQYASSVVTKVWNIANALGYGNYFRDMANPGVYDDHIPVNQIAKIPMIDIIEFNPANDQLFGPYHHTHADNMDIIDKNTLKAVGQTVLQTLFEEGAPLIQ